MDTISEDHKEQNRMLHGLNSNYGAWGHLKSEWLTINLIKPFEISTVLDYGCGKGTLEGSLRRMNNRLVIRSYDPCQTLFSRHPKEDNQTFELVVCQDVLEHVEENYVENVLKDLLDLSDKIIYLDIALGPTKKFYPNGKNAHITQKPIEWWKNKLKTVGYPNPFYEMKEPQNYTGAFNVFYKRNPQ